MSALIDELSREFIRILVSAIISGIVAYYVSRRQYRESQVDQNYKEFLLFLETTRNLSDAINRYLEAYTKYKVDEDEKWITSVNDVVRSFHTLNTPKSELLKRNVEIYEDFLDKAPEDLKKRLKFKEIKKGIIVVIERNHHTWLKYLIRRYYFE